MKRKSAAIVIAVFLCIAEGFCQAAGNFRPEIFQFSTACGFPSRERQVGGALYHFTLSAATQYDSGNLYGYYGIGGYYPSLGFSAGVFKYDGASFPGGTPYSNHYSLSMHYAQTFWSSGKWSSHYYLEGGFGYTPLCYDPVSNPESTFGGHFHVAFHMGAYISYDITDNLRISIGPSYAHHSNSKTNFVNTGCDAISAEVALSYFCQKATKHTEKVSLEAMGVRKRYWDVQYGACVTGGSSDGVSHSGNYVSSKVSVAHLWRTFRRVSFGVGADTFFDKGGNENRNALGLGGAVDYYLTRNLVIAGRVGTYLNGKSHIGSLLYETIGITYTFDQSKWFIPYVGFLTKANSATAEHLELVIGFRLG